MQGTVKLPSFTMPTVDSESFENRFNSIGTTSFTAQDGFSDSFHQSNEVKSVSDVQSIQSIDMHNSISFGMNGFDTTVTATHTSDDELYFISDFLNVSFDLLKSYSIQMHAPIDTTVVESKSKTKAMRTKDLSSFALEIYEQKAMILDQKEMQKIKLKET